MVKLALCILKDVIIAVEVAETHLYHRGGMHVEVREVVLPTKLSYILRDEEKFENDFIIRDNGSTLNEFEFRVMLTCALRAHVKQPK